MFFSKTAFIALVASAAAQSSAVAPIIADLTSINQQTVSLTSSISGWDGTVANSAPILLASTALLKAVNSATTTANSVTGTISDSDQAAVLAAAETLYPNIIKSLTATVAKDPAFASAGLGMISAQTLSGLATASQAFTAALLKSTTGAYLAPGSSLGALISSAFSSAEATKTPTAGTLPSIPAAGAAAPASSAAASSSVAAVASSVASSVAAATSSVAAAVSSSGVGAVASVASSASVVASSVAAAASSYGTSAAAAGTTAAAAGSSAATAAASVTSFPGAAPTMAFPVAAVLAAAAAFAL